MGDESQQSPERRRAWRGECRHERRQDRRQGDRRAGGRRRDEGAVRSDAEASPAGRMSTSPCTGPFAAPFTAQVIGQMMADGAVAGPDTVEAAWRAYHERHRPPRLLR